MTLRIGFDLDGVLADMDRELDRHADDLFGERGFRPQLDESGDAVAPAEAASGGEQVKRRRHSDASAPETSPVKAPLTARQQNRLWRHVEQIDRFWEGLPEIEPGSVARLGRLAIERRWEIIFVTRRPPGAGPTAQVQTQRWLEAHGFPLPSVFVVQGSRGKIADSLELDLVVDDRPENCLDVVVESRAKALLVWRRDEKLLPAAVRRAGIGVVASVAECLDIFTRIEGAAEERPGIADRLVRLLGRRKPPPGG